MIELATSNAYISEDELLDKHADAITRMVEEDLAGDIEHERITQVAMALRNILYWQSKQYVKPSLDATSRVIEFVPIGPDEGKAKLLSSCYNIIESDGVKFIGAVSPRAPNAKALPDDDESERHVALAKDVDGGLRILRRQWDVNRKQKELAYHAWTTGPIFGYTAYQADGHRFGWTEEPVIEVEEADMGLGETMPVPKVTDTKKYPKGGVPLELASVLYVTIPYRSKDLATCPWLCYEYMEHKALLKGLYGERLKDLKYERHHGTSSAAEHSTRAQYQETSPRGQTGEEWQKNRWRYTRYWIRPSYYSLIDVKLGGSSDNDSENELAKALEEQYPDGLKLTLINGKLVAIEHERLDEVWAVCKTGKGDRILGEPWCHNLIPIQDDLNDFFNMAREIILRSIPKTFVDAQLVDRSTINKNEPEIAEMVVTSIPAGMSIGNMMGEMPMARMPDQLVPFAQTMRGYSREIGGVTEALFGGGAPAPTYRGEKQRRDQSMMQFAPFFDETQSFWEKCYTNGLKQWAKYGTGNLVAPGGKEGPALTVDIASFAEEGWHIEAEEGIPMSHAEEVDRFLFLLNENNPEIVAKLGLLSPSNSHHVYKMLGLRGFTAPEQLAREKAQQDIQRLLQENPIEETDPMTGEVITKPSMPIDKFEDSPPDLFAQIYKEWCLASQIDKERNEAGYRNVKARGEEYERLAQQMAMGPMPPGGPGPPVPGPGEEAPLPPPGELPPAPEPESFATEFQQP